MPDILQGNTGLTSTSDLTNTIKSFYDRMLLEVLDPTTRYYQFAMLKPLPGGEGTSVIWNRPTRLALGQKLAPGIKPSASELSTTKVSALIETLGGYSVLEDLVQLTSITDVMNLATERLAQQAAETIDRSIVHAIIRNADITGVSSVHYIKTSASGGFFSNVTSVSSAYYNTTLAVSDVRAVATELRRRYANPFDGENYVGLIHPVVEEDLTSDSTWQNWHQYTTPENLYSGEIGRVHGVRFVRTSLAPVSAGSASGDAISASVGTSAMAYGTMVFGRGFYGATELDGGIKTYTIQGATKSDPLNQETLHGWKAFFTAKVLNVSAGVTMWTGSGDVITGVCTESAREAAGLTLSAIPTAS